MTVDDGIVKKIMTILKFETINRFLLFFSYHVSLEMKRIKLLEIVNNPFWPILSFYIP